MQLKVLNDHVVLVTPECGCKLTLTLGRDGFAHLASHSICGSYPTCFQGLVTAKGLAQAAFDASMPEAELRK